MSQDFYAFLTRLGHGPVDDAWLGTRLLKVEVSPRQVLWRFHIQYKEKPISKTLLAQTAESLCNQLQYLQKLELLIHPISVEPILWQILGRHDTQLTSLLPSGLEPKQIHWTVEDRHLDLHAADFNTYQGLMEGQVCNILSSWLWENYRLRVVVRARPLEAVVREASGPLYIPKQEVVALLPGYGGGPAKKKGHGFKRNQAVLNSGPVVPLKELEDGLRAVVVEGEVWDKKLTLRRDGRLLLVYYLTDGQDSLIVKAFYDHSKEDQIESGDYIRVCGNVNYDPNLHEIAMLMDAWIKPPRTVRDDLESEKRVELHAHTKLSAMDALCEVHELVKKAANWGHKALAITDHGCTQAFPEAYKAARSHKIKLLYGVEAYLVEEDKRERPYHIVLLAQNSAGLKNMYRLVSQSYLSHYYRFPKIPRRLLQEHRQGLLVGSACEAGELFQALLKGIEGAELEKLASFYDYLEIQPLCNNEFLLREGKISSRRDLEDLVARIVSLGKKLGKPVVATGDVHFLEPEHEVYRRIIQAGQGYEDAQIQAPLYLKTTAEMLDEFNFLDDDDKKAVVVDNTLLISNMIEDIKPVPDGFYPPKIDRAEEEISSLAWERVAALYGSNLPELIEARVRKELDSIIRHGFSVLYLIAQKLVKKSNDDGYIVGSRGSVGSSLIAYLTGITEVNPLPPHFRCSYCKWTTFAEDDQADCGADLPDAKCPQCGNNVSKEGFDIPFETFLGFEGDKIPDIDLNFSGEYQNRAHQYVEELFGKENVFRAGTISTIAERTAYGFVARYAEDKNVQLKNSEINRLVRGIAGVRRTTGQHPGGLIVVPRDHDIHEFTPLQHPAENKDSGVITTHFEYHAIGDQLVKLDILGHDDPTVIKALEDLTGISPAGISLSEEKTMQLFSSVEPLGLTPEEAGSPVGTIGVPEFGTRFVRQILESTRPTTFSELVRICGLSHGTDVWLNNAQSLIEHEIAPLNQVICNRDDIMTYLIQKGLEKKQAFKIMEQVRKGKGLSSTEIDSMEACSVPSWYIDSCQKIKYMFPKAHAVAYVINSFRIAYFKVYHPLAFYASFFTVRAEDFEAETVLKGHETIRQRIKDIDKMGNEASQKDRKLLPILEVAAEMCARGYHFYPVDIYQSKAAHYLIKEQGLLLPFSALPNVGRSAAEGVEKAQPAGAFLSVEDFQARTHLNKTSMDVLRQYRCFEGLPESNQIQLFA